MATAKPLPEELAAGSFTIGEARSHGVSPWRAKAKDIHMPSRGITVPAGQEQPLLARARPYTRLGTADTVSFYSAAAIHCFKLPGHLENARLAPSARLLHLTRNGSAAPRRKGVVGHRSVLAPTEIVILQGVPVTSIPRTLPDLAGTGALSCDDIVVIADDLVCERSRCQHPRRSRLPLGELLHYAEQKCPVAGLPLLRNALQQVRVGVDSPPETRLRLLFGRSALPALKRTTSSWTPLAHRCGRTWPARNTVWPWSINKLDIRNGEEWVLTSVRQALRAQGWAG